MKLRDTLPGRLFLRTSAGQRFWRWAHRLYDPWAQAAQLARTYRRNAGRAQAEHGLRYRPAAGAWPAFIHYPPDLHLSVTFPDGEQLPLHLTEERGYEDIDGCQHLPIYTRFVQTVYPLLAGAPELAVLDCACGSGYGSNYLHRVLNRPVIGLDVDEGVVRYARKRYGGQPGLTYLAGDAAELPALAPASILAVISVETIEHIPEPDRALAAFARVLAPGGALFITSPDATRRPGTFVSAFHVREYSQAEFQALLARHFAEVRVEAAGEYLIGVGRRG